MRGFLRFIVLRLIHKHKGITGQDIRKEIEKRRGSMPSPGTIYPVLKSLRKSMWIKETDSSGREKSYVLTLEGRKMLKESTHTFIRIFHDMKEEFEKHTLR